MFTHNLKIAFRNMRKYKNQTLISVIGLAVGFTCFSLATLWLRYEMTFDSFHKNAGQMYVVYGHNLFGNTDYHRTTIYPLAAYLNETFPEITDAIPLSPPYSRRVTVENVEIPMLYIQTDSSFFRMFDVKIIEGSRDFLIPGSRKLAITWEKALQLFGDENPIGKTINRAGIEFTICAIVSDMPKRSNYAFDFIEPVYSYALDPIRGWTNGSGVNAIIKLLPQTNINAFEKKLYEHNTGEGRGNINKMTIKPLTKLRYTDPNIEREVRFQHIVIFSVSGLLVVLCSLFNYLTMFASRFRIRQKEMVLRMVCGATGRSLLATLSVEFIIMLLLSVVLGCMMTQLFHRPFLILSEIQMNLPAVYRESLMYIGGVILISLLAFWLILIFFRHRSLNQSIRKSNNNLSRKISVIVQLIISTGFAFCTIVILKQMYFLHHTNELGFSFQNRGAIAVNRQLDGGVLINHLKQIPEITEIVDATLMGDLFNNMLGRRISIPVHSWNDKPADVEYIRIEQNYVSSEYTAFYNFRLLSGEMLTDADSDSLVLLNESAVKAFGWYDPIGKRFANRYTVKGVIKNVYNFAPIGQANPIFYSKPTISNELPAPVILFKYQEGRWKSCKEKIEQIMIQKDFADFRYGISIFEEEYNKFLKSEKALIKLLSLVSAICVLICVFGFVSLVSLTCEERRKSIAIRKINGATAGDILGMFAKEYFMLLFVGAAIAFTTGYFIMQRWLENYAIRTNIPAWIYLSIVCVLAFVIVLCVGWQVYRSSIENPAEVVKSE